MPVIQPIRTARAGARRRGAAGSKAIGCLAILGLCVLVAAGLVSLGRRPPAEPRTVDSPATRARDDSRAVANAEDLVRQSLVNRWDASFSWSPQVHWDADGSTARVRGTVEAPNLFGAKVTRPYDVLLTQEDGALIPTYYALGDEVVFDLRLAFEKRKKVARQQAARQESADEPADPGAGASGDPASSATPGTPVPRGQPLAQARTWTDAVGAYTVEAEFVGLIDDRVRLRRMADGKTIWVPLERLSAEDRAWIAERKAGR